MLRVSISTSLVLFALMCCANDGSRQIAVKNSPQAKPDEILRNTAEDKFNIKKTRGVVVLSKYDKGDFVRFYNEDGSLWYEFTFYFDESGGKFPYANDDFRPFAFHSGYFLLVLKCTEIRDNFFQVVVNEETGLRKYINANDPVMKLQTWDEFVLTVFAVTFDQKTNPLLEIPNGRVKKVAVPKDATFRPVETRGNWLRVRWDSAGDETTDIEPNANGWIRWRSDEALLIDFYYFA